MEPRVASVLNGIARGMAPSGLGKALTFRVVELALRDDDAVRSYPPARGQQWPLQQYFVGNAGVGVVSLRGAPLTLPVCATAQFKAFFDCGRVIRCTLPLGAGRFMHLVVLYGYQGLLLILNNLL